MWMLGILSSFLCVGCTGVTVSNHLAGLAAGFKPRCSCLVFRKSAGPDHISMLCCLCQIMNIMVDSWRVAHSSAPVTLHPDMSVTFICHKQFGVEDLGATLEMCCWII